MNRAKVWLEQLQDLENRMDMLRSEYDRLQTIATGITGRMDTEVHGGGGGDRIGTCAAAMADISRNMAEQVAEYAAKRQRMIVVLMRIDNLQQRKLLYKRYLEHKTMELCADEMGYSLRGACYLHNAALVTLGAMIEKEMDQ